jgi:hypothetical protein
MLKSVVIILFPADLADFRRYRMIISVNLRYLRNLREPNSFQTKPIISNRHAIKKRQIFGLFKISKNDN